MTARTIIIIPAYDEAETIAGVLSDLRDVAPDYDRLVVNDGSGDDTAAIVNGSGEKLLDLQCNLGYGAALQTGMKYALAAGYDVIVCFDADGQHQSGDVVRLVTALETEAADLIIGSRFAANGRYSGPWTRRFGQQLFSQLTRFLLGSRIYDTTSGFKVLRARACQELINGVFMDFHTEVLVRLGLFGYRIVEVPIAVTEREHGSSMYSLRSSVEYPLKTLLLTLVSVFDVALTKRTR